MTCVVGRQKRPALSAAKLLCGRFVMAGADPTYYWDSCLFLAWIKDEERPSGEMDGVREVIARAKRRDCKIITSTITLVECLQSKLPVGVDRLFKDMLKRVHRVSVDIK